MKEKILGILNIRSGESAMVFDLMFVQFFLGLATSFLLTISYTFFLEKFSINQLPVAFLFIAVILLMLNIFYEKLEHSFSPIALLRLVIFISMICLSVVLTGIISSQASWLIFSLIICS